MKILFINQTFYPDPVATAYYVTDVAAELVKQKHSVTVLSAMRGYAEPHPVYPSRGAHLGVNVVRVWPFAFGRRYKFLRILDSLMLNAAFFAEALLQPKYDVVIALTSPPLVAFFATLVSRIKKSKFVYWVMDMNPDEAVAMGWLKKGSWVELLLAWMQKQILKVSSKTIVLDKYMLKRLQAYKKGTTAAVLPMWAHGFDFADIPQDENNFRKKYVLEKKFIVMYAGNHSMCHPLDTVLRAALLLKKNEDISFVFLGGGVKTGDVSDYKTMHGLTNILQIPYIHMSELQHPISAANLHLVVMGNNMTGIVHPCKIYGILSLGRPFVYIGPAQSHVADLIKEGAVGYSVCHGEAQELAEIIQRNQNAGQPKIAAVHSKNKEIGRRFSAEEILPRFVREILG